MPNTTTKDRGFCVAGILPARTAAVPATFLRRFRGQDALGTRGRDARDTILRCSTKLPRVSGAQAIGILERIGFHQVRQRGSHVVLRREGVGCVIPLHRELAVGTLRVALRQAGVTPEQFTQAMKRR